MESRVLAVRAMSENKLFVIPFEKYYIELINQGFEIYKKMKDSNELHCKPILIFPDINGIKMYSLLQGFTNKIDLEEIEVSKGSIENMFLDENGELYYDSNNSYLVETSSFFNVSDYLFKNLSDRTHLSNGFVDLLFEDETLHIKSNDLIANQYYLSEAINANLFKNE